MQQPAGFTLDRYGTDRMAYQTFREAEKAARGRYSRKGHAKIYCHPADSRKGGVELAEIKRDGNGKLWVDLTWAGCSYA
jgi:hypothetical protein